VKKFLVIPFLNFTKLNYFIFEMLKKEIWANFQRIIELFTQKIVSKLSKIWVWDPESVINLFRIPDLGVKKAPDPDPQHCLIDDGRIRSTSDQMDPDPGDPKASGSSRSGKPGFIS
jgi:hypothetical protein